MKIQPLKNNVLNLLVKILYMDQLLFHTTWKLQQNLIKDVHIQNEYILLKYKNFYLIVVAFKS